MNTNTPPRQPEFVLGGDSNTAQREKLAEAFGYFGDTAPEQVQYSIATSSRNELPGEIQTKLNTLEIPSTNYGVSRGTEPEIEAILKKYDVKEPEYDSKIFEGKDQKLQDLEVSYDEQAAKIRDEARANLPPKINAKLMTPSQMLLEGLGEMTVSITLDAAEDFLLGDPVSEWVIDTVTGKLIEKVTNRRMRTVSWMVANPFMIFTGMRRKAAHLAPVQKFNPVNPKGLNKPLAWLSNKSFTVKTQLHTMNQRNFALVNKTLAKFLPLPVPNAIPVISALISTGAIDGALDIKDAIVAMAKGQKYIEVETMNSVDVTPEYIELQRKKAAEANQEPKSTDKGSELGGTQQIPPVEENPFPKLNT